MDKIDRMKTKKKCRMKVSPLFILFILSILFAYSSH
jgi:hypothetical protein